MGIPAALTLKITTSEAWRARNSARLPTHIIKIFQMSFQLSKALACLLVSSALTTVPLQADEPASVSAADTAVPLGQRLSRISAEKKVRDRLKNLSDAGSKLAVGEIQESLLAAEGFKQLRERVVLREATLKRWSELAPAEAFAYIAKLPESRLKTEGLRFAALKMADKDPEEAARAVTQLTAGAARNDSLEAVAESWARSNAAQALRWAAGLPDGASKDSVLISIWFVWVHAYPAAASAQVHMF